MRRAEADGDARQAGDRLDDPDQLRRPEHAAELPVSAGAKSVMRTAPPLRSVRTVDDDRGVAQIFRLEIGHVVEHDVGKSLLLVAREQAAEDRVAVKARIAPPHQTRRGIDERSRAPVADDGKIEPVIDHEAASASVREICSSQWRTSVGRSKQDLTPGTFRPDGNADSVKVGHDLEYAEIGLVVAEKNGAAIGKWRVGHQFAHGGRLGEPGLLDFHHQLSRQQFDRGPP